MCGQTTNGAGYGRIMSDMEDDNMGEELHISSAYNLGKHLVTCRHNLQQGRRPQFELPPPRTPEKACF